MNLDFLQRQENADNEVIFERSKLARMRRDGYLNEYLLTMAALIILRWVDRLETEEEAIAEFEGEPYTRTNPPELSYSYWKNLPPPEIPYHLSRALHFGAPTNAVSEILARVAEVYEPEKIDPRWLHDALMLIGFIADGSVSGGPRLAKAFDELIAEYSAESSKSFGQYVTPQHIAELMIELANPQPGERIYDPCFGVGTVLAAAGRKVVSAGDRLSPAKWAEIESRAIYGIELNRQAYLLGLARVILSGINNPHLEFGDTLQRTHWRDTPERFDCIIADPPWGGKNTDNLFDSCIYAKSSNLENLFLQHVMASLNPGGRAVMLLPGGVLFRGGADEEVRRRLMTDFCIDGVISLPAGMLFPYAGIKTNIIVFHRAEPNDKIWFQSADFVVKRDKSNIREELNKQLHLFREQKAGIHGWFTPINELADRGWSLVADRVSERAEDEIAGLLKNLQEKDGEIKVEPLDGLAQTFTGVAYSSGQITENQSDLTYQPGIPLIRIGDVKNGRVNLPERYLTEGITKRLQEKHRLKAGDLLLSVTGTIGKIGVVSSSEVGAVPSQGLLVIRPDKRKIKSNYLLRLLQSVPYQNRIKGSSSGAVIQHLRATVIKSLPIPVPSAEIQNKIGFDLNPEADASAVLQSLMTGRAANELETFLLTDQAVNELLKEHENFGADDLKRNLITVSRSLTMWRNQNVLGLPANRNFYVWVNSVAHATEYLGFALDVSNPAERLLILEGLKNTPLVNPYNVELPETSLLAERIEAINSTISRTIETERRKILQIVRITGRVESPIIDVGSSAELIIRLKNESPVSLVKFVSNIQSLEIQQEANTETRILEPGSEISLPFTFPAQSEPGTHDLTVFWQASSLESEYLSGSCQVAIEVRSLRRTATVEEIGNNPYEVGDPITKVEMFFGRDDILERIRRKLGENGGSAVFLLEGNRRTGKTSILNRLLVPHYLPNCLPVYVSMQDLEGDLSVAGVHTDEIFYGIARNLVLASYQADYPTFVMGYENIYPKSDLRGLTRLLRGPFRAEFKKGNPFEILKIQVDEVLTEIGQDRILFMLDEFDKIQEGIDNGVTSPQLPENLRALFQSSPRLSAILTGWRIRRLREEYRNALYGIGIPLKVSALDIKAAQELVTRPVTGRLVIPPSIRDEIVSTCARQPYLIQYLCDRLFEDCAMNDARTITNTMVEAAASKIVEGQEGFEHFIKMWEFIGANRRRYLTCLIDELSFSPDPVTFDLITEKLTQRGDLYQSQTAIGDDIEFLRELEIIALKEEGGQKVYSLEVPLFAQWRRSQKDPSDYLKRALEEVDV